VICVYSGRSSPSASLGVDGIVAGFLQGGEIDIRAMDAVSAAASRVGATFHHAFDELPDPATAVQSLSRWPRIDRVLTSAGPGFWIEKTTRLDRLCTSAPPGVGILAGRGVDEAALRALARSSVREAHVGRAARVPATVNGAVSSRRVVALVEAAQR
jgi:copper homeostasis protein